MKEKNPHQLFPGQGNHRGSYSVLQEMASFPGWFKSPAACSVSRVGHLRISGVLLEVCLSMKPPALWLDCLSYKQRSASNSFRMKHKNMGSGRARKKVQVSFLTLRDEDWEILCLFFKSVKCGVSKPAKKHFPPSPCKATLRG